MRQRCCAQIKTHTRTKDALFLYIENRGKESAWVGGRKEGSECANSCVCQSGIAKFESGARSADLWTRMRPHIWAGVSITHSCIHTRISSIRKLVSSVVRTHATLINKKFFDQCVCVCACWSVDSLQSINQSINRFIMSMAGPTCSNCGSSEFETDPSRGDTVCTRCGIVIEDNAIVNEIQFEEGGTSVIGQRVNEETGARSFSAVLLGVSKHSRYVTLGEFVDQVTRIRYEIIFLIEIITSGLRKCQTKDQNGRQSAEPEQLLHRPSVLLLQDGTQSTTDPRTQEFSRDRCLCVHDLSSGIDSTHSS